MMTKLGDRNYTLISMGCKTTGTYEPDECLGPVEEQMYIEELPTIQAFLQWCHDTGKAFGHGNYEERFAEWLKVPGQPGPEQNITEHFGNNNQWAAELNIEWDGDDLVSWCHVSTTRNGQDYCSSLTCVEAWRTVEGDGDDDVVKVPDNIFKAINRWAMIEGY